MPINTNLCENRLVTAKDKVIMLQAASIFSQGDGGEWDGSEMLEVMFGVVKTSLKVLASDLFKQMTEKTV
jgi:type II restriction enzyme